jgi:hypothetical protein
MARSESRTKVSIWSNEDFITLSRQAQRVYWMVYSQPTISLCGVLAFTPGRWSRYASDGTVSDIEDAIADLERSHFVIVDRDTEEVFVRSFMRNDGVWRSPKTRGAARDQVNTVMSKTLREAVAVEMSRLDRESLTDGACGGGSDAQSDEVSDTSRAHTHASSSLLSPVSDSNLRSPDDDVGGSLTREIDDRSSSSTAPSGKF